MNPMLASADSTNSAATARSACLACWGGPDGSAGSQRSTSPSVSGGVSSSVLARAGGGVPITRCGARVSCGSSAPSPGGIWPLPCVSLDASRRFIVIHIAANTRAAMPPRNATSPSVTGPTRPRLNPPGFGSARTLVT